MRALCLLALFGATLSGCCSAHRAWMGDMGNCVSQGGDCCPTPHKSCWFQKLGQSHGGCSCGTSCGSGCGDCGPCGSGCGGCSNDMMSSGMPSGGCSSCAQGQTIYEGTTDSSMSTGTSCPSCQQNQMIPSSGQPASPTPPAPPANPMQNPPEPTTARMMQPCRCNSRCNPCK